MCPKTSSLVFHLKFVGALQIVTYTSTSEKNCSGCGCSISKYYIPLEGYLAAVSEYVVVQCVKTGFHEKRADDAKKRQFKKRRFKSTYTLG